MCICVWNFILETWNLTFTFHTLQIFILTLLMSLLLNTVKPINKLILENGQSPYMLCIMGQAQNLLW